VPLQSVSSSMFSKNVCLSTSESYDSNPSRERVIQERYITKLLTTFFTEHCLYKIYRTRQYRSSSDRVRLLVLCSSVRHLIRCSQGFGSHSSGVNTTIWLHENFLKFPTETFFGLSFSSVLNVSFQGAASFYLASFCPPLRY
jgi:hypothetical protein